MQEVGTVAIMNMQERRNEGLNMQETARFILGLRAAGWSEKQITDFMLYIESGDERYKPTPQENKEEHK